MSYMPRHLFVALALALPCAVVQAAPVATTPDVATLDYLADWLAETSDPTPDAPVLQLLDAPTDAPATAPGAADENTRPLKPDYPDQNSDAHRH